jgi:putative resolvase
MYEEEKEIPITNEHYLSFKSTRKLLQVSSSTLRNWDKEGKIRTIRTPSGARMFNQQDLSAIIRQTKSNEIVKRKICYARVSTRAQMDDLERQVLFFRTQYPSYEVVTDICSGINWKRKGLSSLLEQSIQGTLGEIVVAHKDRLSRIAFDLLEYIFNLHGTQILVLDRTNEQSTEQELAQDIMSIVHVYSCKQMGKRRYTKSNQDKIEQKV